MSIQQNTYKWSATWTLKVERKLWFFGVMSMFAWNCPFPLINLIMLKNWMEVFNKRQKYKGDIWGHKKDLDEDKVCSICINVDYLFPLLSIVFIQSALLLLYSFYLLQNCLVEYGYYLAQCLGGLKVKRRVLSARNYSTSSSTFRSPWMTSGLL